MNLSASSVMMAAFMFVGSQTGPNEKDVSIPSVVAKVTDRYARSCSLLGGEPSAGPAFILVADYTGDGADDFVVNSHAFTCEGADIAVCVREKCEVTIFAAKGEGPFGFERVERLKAEEEPYLNVLYNQGFEAVEDDECTDTGACVVASLVNE